MAIDDWIRTHSSRFSVGRASVKNVVYSPPPFVSRIKGPAANSASRMKRSIKRHVRYRFCDRSEYSIGPITAALITHSLYYICQRDHYTLYTLHTVQPSLL